MLSLDNVNDDEQLAAWLKRVRKAASSINEAEAASPIEAVEILTEPKLDGVSLALRDAPTLIGKLCVRMPVTGLSDASDRVAVVRSWLPRIWANCAPVILLPTRRWRGTPASKGAAAGPGPKISGTFAPVL